MYTGFPRSWKIQEKLAVMESHEKSWNMKISQKVMEKSWSCLFSWLWQLSSLWLSCMLWDTIKTISETMWEWESWKEANQSWKSHGILFSDFCGNPVHVSRSRKGWMLPIDRWWHLLCFTLLICACILIVDSMITPRLCSDEHALSLTSNSECWLD